MFKKILFVFVLAAAVLTFAGYSVPTASACSGIDGCIPIIDSKYAAPAQTQSLSSDTSNAMFGPSFVTVQPVAAGTNNYQMSAGQYEKVPGHLDLENPSGTADPTFNSISLQ